MNNNFDGEDFLTATVTMNTETVPCVSAQEAMKKIGIAATIKRLVAAETGITVKELIGQSRVPRLSHPRQLSMYLIRMFSDYSTPQIGRMFDDRDHTTVLWAIVRVEERLRADARLVELVARLTSKIELETGLRPGVVETVRGMGSKLSKLRLRVYCDLPGTTGITN